MSSSPSYRLSLTESLKIRFLRALKWEYWPTWIFYLPVVLLGIGYSLKGRGLDFFSANPGLPVGGALADHKYIPLKALSDKAPGFVPASLLIAAGDHEATWCMTQLQSWMQHHDLTFPVVLKPDTGARGQAVSIIQTKDQAKDYFQRHPQDIVAQEYISGREFGLFYCDNQCSDTKDSNRRLFSIAEKTFPTVTGDGKLTVRQLIMADPHAVMCAQFLLWHHRAQLLRVPACGEQVPIIDLGTHSKGSIFLDAQHLWTFELDHAAAHVANAIGGYHVGRLDVRAKDTTALQRGDFRVMEANGVTAEAAHLYQPGTCLWQAWKILLRQWRLAYAIGRYNINKGSKAYSVREVLHAVLR